MELYKIRGGNLTDLKDKKYNIGIGVSLGNKWFTMENIIELVKWSLLRTRESVVIYVADRIHAINLEVRKKISSDRAMHLSLGLGEKILGEVKAQIQNTFGEKDLSRIYYANWGDISDESFRRKIDYLYSVYAQDEKFRDAIHTLVDSNTSKEERKFTDEEIDKLGTYIIEELPELLCRVPIKGLVCDAFVYPFDGELLKFVEDIQLGRIFPRIKESIMDTEPKVFLEVR